jgi:hypothetical protein
VIAAAQDVATSWKLTQLVCSEFKGVGDTWQILHLNHESWNPEAMNNII